MTLHQDDTVTRSQIRSQLVSLLTDVIASDPEGGIKAQQAHLILSHLDLLEGDVGDSFVLSRLGIVQSAISDLGTYLNQRAKAGG